MEASSARARRSCSAPRRNCRRNALRLASSMKFSPASMIALINQLASQRWPNLRPAGAKKFSQSENRQRWVRSANSHLDSHILPQLGKLRLDQVGPENQQVFVNQLAGASRKTVLNILSTLSSMLATAKNWGYSSVEIALRKLVLPERNVHVPAHFTRSQVESILSLANEPWRTFFIVFTPSSTRSIFRGAAFMLSDTPLRPSSWTQATRQRSQNNSSAIPTPAQHSTTFICEAESPNGRWRTFQIP